MRPLGKVIQLYNPASYKFYCGVILNELHEPNEHSWWTKGIYFAIKFHHKPLGYTDHCSPFVVSSILEAS